MNFLAHIYLSGEDKEIMIGNFIADGIKGKTYTSFPKKVQLGILLHREIDSFTDNHPIFRQSTKRLHKKYGHYSGVIIDIFYDHFLAKNWANYSPMPLADFVADFYALLEQNYTSLPKRIQNMLPYMLADNWLLSYATLEGIERILYQMNIRTKNRAKMHLAIQELKVHYPAFEYEFTSFFKELILFTTKKTPEIQAILEK